MELRHLRYFVAVAEEGSLSRAAERLGIQQPPLGQQIRALEAELGLQLFDRSAKRVQLNASGQIFLEGARRTLAHAGEAVNQVIRYQRGEQGTLVLGYTFAASLHELAPRMIHAFRNTYPKVAIEVQESDSYNLIVAVQERRMDVACIHTDIDAYGDLTSIVLDQQPMIVAVPINHPIAQTKRGSTSLKRLAQEFFVAYHRPEGPSIHQWLLRQFEAAGLSMKVVDSVYRLIAAINLVAAGRGISIVPASLEGLHSKSIVYRAIEDRALAPLPFRIIYRKDERSKLVQNFVSVCKILQTQRALTLPNGLKSAK